MVKNADFEQDEVMATDEELFLADQMTDCLIKIWKLVGCFAAGWLLLWLGMAFTDYAVDQFGLGMFCAIAGIALMPLPSVMLLWGGAGFREMFSTEYFIETTYADGHKTTSFDLSGTLISKIITLGLAFLLGFIITPIRIIIGVLTFWRAKKKLGVGKLPLKEDVLLPFIVAAGTFLLGIILNITITGIAHATYDKRMSTSDYTAEETVEIINGWKESLTEKSFTYSIQGYTAKEGERCFIEVSYDKGRYAFTVSAAYTYDLDAREKVYLTQEDSLVPFGTYVYENGEWLNEAADLTDAQKSLLEDCTVESYLAEFLKHDLILKNKRFMGQNGYCLTFRFEYDGETEEVILEVYNDGTPYRLFGALTDYDGIYGGNSYDILFD